MSGLKARIRAWATAGAFRSLLVARLLALRSALFALRHRVRHWGRCYIAWNARITGWTGMQFGRNVIISRHCWLNVNDRRSGVPSLRIGDNTYIGQNNLFAVGRTMVFREYGITGPNCAFIAASHVTSNPLQPYCTTSATAKDDIYIGVNTYFGHGCSVIGNVRIGHGSIVGAGSLVRADVPPFCVVVGNPARVVRHYDFTAGSWAKGEPPADRPHPEEESYLATLRAMAPFPLQPVSGAAFLLGDV
jgi:acetyltransferase-like isoleucine patch superfamily enzyme